MKLYRFTKLTDTELDDLVDVSVAAPVDNDALTWDNTASEWVAAEVGTVKEGHITLLAVNTAVDF